MRQNAAARNDHFPAAFVASESLAVMTFLRSVSQAGAIFYRMIQLRNAVYGIFMRFKREISKDARITIIHVRFIALTFAGFLGRCLNSRRPQTQTTYSRPGMKKHV